MDAATPLRDELQAAAEWIASADALVIAAGAGMGVDSGLPDFRGAEGFWRAYPVFKERGLAFWQVASPSTFEEDPELAWGFYGHRLALYRSTVPHAGFGIVQRWAEASRFGGWVFTSNVDGQFQRAGFDAERIVECHGSIHQLQCTRPCGSHVWQADDTEPVLDGTTCRLISPLPRCPHCGAVARPRILMFSDSGWHAHSTARQEIALGSWLRKVSRTVVVEIGAGIDIPTVRSFSHGLVIDHDAVLIRINPREPSVPRSRDVSIATGALTALQEIDRVLRAL